MCPCFFPSSILWNSFPRNWPVWWTRTAEAWNGRKRSARSIWKTWTTCRDGCKKPKWRFKIAVANRKRSRNIFRYDPNNSNVTLSIKYLKALKRTRYTIRCESFWIVTIIMLEIIIGIKSNLINLISRDASQDFRYVRCHFKIFRQGNENFRTFFFWIFRLSKRNEIYYICGCLYIYILQKRKRLDIGYFRFWAICITVYSYANY